MTRLAGAALLLALGCRRDAPPRALDEDVPAPRAAPSARYRPALRDVLRPEARRALDESTVALLVPNDPGLVATAVVTSGRHWAAASIARGDHTITVHASRATPAPPPPPTRPTRRPQRPEEPAVEARIRGVHATLRGGGGQRVATWEERGVTYVLDVACTRADDPRCGTERFLRDLATSLVRLEGGR